MARKQSAPAPAPQEINEEVLNRARDARDERAVQLMVIDRQFGDDNPYDTVRMISQAKFYMNNVAHSIIEAGKCLILLKEHEEHGNFLRALEAIGIAPRAAQKIMLVAAKFANTPALAHLGQTKLLELAVLDDDTLAELEKGGSYANLTITDMDRMSYRELKAKLAEKEEALEAAEEAVARKDKIINKLDRERRRTPELQPWSEQCAGLVDEIEGIVKKIGPQLGAMNERIGQLGELMADQSPSDEEGKATAIQVMNAVHVLVNLLAPAQQRMYDEFQAYVPIKYTSTFSPKD